VVGAGCSLADGMPSTNDVHNLFLQWGKDVAVLSAHPDESLYSYLYQELRRFWRVTCLGRGEPNFEDMLYLIASLAGLYPQGTYTSSLAALIGIRPFPDVYFSCDHVKVSPIVLNFLASNLVDRLLDEFRSRCRSVPAAGRLSGFFGALAEEYECAFATTNYDDLIWRAVPGLETGFNPGDRSFSPRRLFERPAWSCLLHLHGSVHFDMLATKHELHALHWRADLNEQFAQNSFGRNSTFVREGQSFPTSSIIAGFGKTVRLQGQPFRTYHAEFDRLSSDADAVLFLGYGFGDEHINGAFDSFRDDRNRPVVVVGFGRHDELAVSGTTLEQSPDYAQRALPLFKTPHWRMTWGDTGLSASVAELNRRGEFERSKDQSCRLALWHGGVQELHANGLTKLFNELA